MSSVTKSGRRKRESKVDRELQQKKRVCLENFFTETISPEVVLNKFHNLIEDLENEDINLPKLKSITKNIRQLKVHGLLKQLKVSDVMKVIKKLTNFIKTGFIRNFQSSYEWDLIKWKSNVEVTFEACLISLFLLSSEDVLEAEDVDVHVNDIIFFLRKVFDDVNTQLTRVKDVKKINNSTLKELLLDNLVVVNDLIRIRNFNSLNVTGLITSFIQTVLYYTDPEVQKNALLSIVNFYRKGEEFRALILNLVFKSVDRVSEHYKFKRNYTINGSLSVSLFTVLIMSLIENVPILGFHPCESCDLASNQDLMKESFENIMKVSCFIITTFIQKIGTYANGHKTYNLFFGHLIVELIQVSNEPEWPSAKLILNLLLRPLTEILTMKPPAEVPLRVLAVKALSQIIKQKIIDTNLYEDILESLNQKFTNVDEEYDFTEFTQRLLVHRLKKSNKTDLNANHPLIHAIQWFDNLKYKPSYEEKILNLTKLFTEDESSGSEVSDLNENETRAILYYLDTVRRNYVDYNVILKYVLCCYYDKHRKVKYTATQYVFELISLDGGLLSQSIVSNIVHENLLTSSTAMKERLCAVINSYLTSHPEKSDEYAPYLLRLLDIQVEGVQKTCIDLVLKILKTQPELECKTQLFCKILRLLQSDNSVLQKQVVQFCSEVWLNNAVTNLNTLLDIVEMPHANRYLRLFFEEKLKPPTVPLMSDTPSQPATQTVDSCRNLVRFILDKIKKNERTLQCLQTISVFVTSYPKAFVEDLFVIAGPLTLREYTKDYAVEILTAEILNCILPEVVNPDVLKYITLRSELVDKIMSNDGLNYSMGLIVSLLKLVNNLSNFDRLFLYDNCFQPSMDILQEYRVKHESSDNRIISRALCIAIYLHVYFQGENQNFQTVLDFYIHHRIFALTTIHCLCYLSMDYKLIMNNDIIKKTIAKYLQDKRYPVLLRAVLYNILCSLKNIHGGQWSKAGDSIEPLKNLVQEHIADILDCIIDQRTEIRQVTYGVIRHLLSSGLVPESRLIPSVLLMSTDPVESLAEVGVDILHQMQTKKLFDFLRNSAKCIIASLVFNLRCAGRDFIRGYVNQRGRTEAKCNHFYVLYQDEIMSRRQVIDSLINGIGPDGETTAVEKLYLSDNLACFTYKYQEEVYYVLWQVETVLMASSIPDVPLDPNEKQGYVRKYYGLYALTFVKSCFRHYYGFNGEKLRKYYQEDGKRDLVQTKKFFLYDVPLLPTSQDFDTLCENIFNVVKRQQKQIKY